MKNANRKTLVKFLVNDGELFAFFPQLNYNKKLYGNVMKYSYSKIGQHSACHIDFAKESKPATLKQYKDLYKHLSVIGYDVKILNK